MKYRTSFKVNMLVGKGWIRVGLGVILCVVLRRSTCIAEDAPIQLAPLTPYSCRTVHVSECSPSTAKNAMHQLAVPPYLNQTSSHYLQQIFVCISFYFNPLKLVFLEKLLSTLLSYPTRADILVITNNEIGTRKTLSDWGMPQVSVLWFNTTGQKQQFALLFAHRKPMQEAFISGKYDTFLYLEDDQIITWDSLVSWARDTALLEPHGLYPGFVRTEYSNNGDVVLLDWKRDVAVDALPDLSLPAGARPLRFYVSVPRSFQGFWIASYNLMSKFVKHPTWIKSFALEQQVPAGSFPERSTWMAQLVDVPEGFQTNLVIPYDPAARKLFETSRVRHLRNGYSTQRDSGLGKLGWDKALVKSKRPGHCKTVALCSALPKAEAYIQLGAVPAVQETRESKKTDGEKPAGASPVNRKSVVRLAALGP